MASDKSLNKKAVLLLLVYLTAGPKIKTIMARMTSSNTALLFKAMIVSMHAINGSLYNNEIFKAKPP